MDSLDLFTPSLMIMKHLPILQKAAMNLPSYLSDMVLPGYTSFRNVSHDHVNYGPMIVLIFCNRGLCEADLEHRGTERERLSTKRGRYYYHF